jgi:hypothetical protein
VLTKVLRSRAWQAGAVAHAFALVAARHYENDGLWFPDAPLHAANGLFWWDLLGSMPVDPVEFAIRYYARYPIIRPAAYPPLFYLLEGLAFAIVGPSPYVAKLVVLTFGVVAGLYTMAWARRWIGEGAGWTGVLLAFMPGVVVWSNAVMLNVPAMALGLAALYHCRRWIEDASATQLLLTVGCFTALVLTYYPGAAVVSVLAAWALLFRCRDRGLPAAGPRVLWLTAGALAAFVPLAASLLLGPVHAARHLPSWAFLAEPRTWTYYWAALPGIVGIPVLVAALLGVVAAAANVQSRREIAYVAVWIAALVLSVSPLPPRDPRYIMLAAPAFVIAAAAGLAWLVRERLPISSRWHAAGLAIVVAAGFWSATRVDVPRVTGFREVAAYLEKHAPRDAVMYDGAYGALFGFYVRASDPQFERRVAAANKLLYQYGPTTAFEWVQTSHVSTTDDVVSLLRRRSGCRWLAIAVTPRPTWLKGQQLLQEAVQRPEFELVRSFATSGAAGRRVDLYRIVADVDPVDTVDLQFPSFSSRDFRQVVPITR